MDLITDCGINFNSNNKIKHVKPFENIYKQGLKRIDLNTKFVEKINVDTFISKLYIANSRDEFNILANFLKSLKASFEKTKLAEAYLDKYNKWIKSLDKLNIKMQYEPSKVRDFVGEVTEKELEVIRNRLKNNPDTMNCFNEYDTKERIVFLDKIYSEEKLYKNRLFLDCIKNNRILKHSIILLNST